jgi:hypothetical protein
MALSWWDIPFLLAAIIVGIGPLVWALVLDGRPQRLEREVLADIERLPVAEESPAVRIEHA